MKNICKEHKQCTGCTACTSACPKQCIEMKRDDEGFKYPVIDVSKCIRCGLCEKICPVNHPTEKNGVVAGYVARYKDIDTVIESTSGGSFSAFADYTFIRNGLLYGVGYDENLTVNHFGINVGHKEQVSEMIGSKYVQSDLKQCFTEIKDALKTGRFVCFSGTPCQVAGLKAYLKKNYENLITVDLVCHGVASPLLFEKYVSYMQEKEKSKVVNVKFRNKTYGYHSGTMMVQYANGKKYYGSGRVDYMSKAYFKGACSRYSCYECQYKGIERCSDFTVFDSWHVEQLVWGKKDDDKGYTNIFVHTEKGKRVICEMTPYLEIWEADTMKMKLLDGVMIDNNPTMDRNRAVLIKEASEQSFEGCMQKYLPVSSTDKIVEKTKAILYRIGLLSSLKR